LLRLTEVAGELTRAFAVVKMRDSEFDRGVRRLTVTSTGIHIGDPLREADMVLSGQPRQVRREGRG
jgi:circadian clock protein KaiC